MNRQQRRLQKRKNEKDTTYNLTSDQIVTLHKNAVDQAFDEVMSMEREMLNQKAKESINEAVTKSFYIFIMTLRNMGFGKVRLKRFINKAIEEFNMWEEGYYTIPDVIETVKDETGLKLNFEMDFKNKETQITIDEN